jgi:hypothetical protein
MELSMIRRSLHVHFIGASAALALASIPSAATQGDPAIQRLSAGLTAKIDASRTCGGESMTVTVAFSNTGKAPVDVIFVEQASAVDNAGVAYRMRGYSGTAQCKHHYVQDCLGLSGRGLRVPLEQFTRLDPGAGAVAIFDLWHSSPRKATLVTFSATYGYRIVDETREGAHTDAEKVRTVKTMSVGFPPFPMNMVGCR